MVSDRIGFYTLVNKQFCLGYLTHICWHVKAERSHIYGELKRANPLEQLKVSL